MAAEAGGAKETGPAATEEPTLLLMSWNVAGWKTTMEHLRRFKGGLSGFLQRHHVDVLCLQEVKLTAKAITTEAVPLGVEPPGFESFWACNEGSGGQRQGLNGVATYARRGQVLRADSAPLRSRELDGEGRCLLTDHGPFVLFNVYVPNHAWGPRLLFKLRWLGALRAAMQRERQAGKAVILAGDLNLKHRPKDCHWLGRPVQISKLTELGLPQAEQQVLAAACDAWPSVGEALRAREVRQIETRNSRNGQVFQRWGVFVRSLAGEVVRVGDPMSSEDEGRWSFNAEGADVEEDGRVVRGNAAQTSGAGAEEGDALQLTPPGTLAAHDLAECLRRIASIDLDKSLLRTVSDAIGGVLSPPSVQAWLREVLEQDGMADSFVELHPHAEERFTCWDQYRNRRHENIGSRIDYILVDRPLLMHVARGCDLDTRGAHEPNSAAAALSAATLGGLSQPSPFAGGGMPALEEDEYFAQFRDQPSTGVVYTPQQLSDHVATSLLLRGCRVGDAHQQPRTKDAATQRCQPYRAGKRITDFFGTKRSSSSELAPDTAKRTALCA